MASPDTSAVVTGTPLLGDQQLLEKYNYLTGSAVYLKQSGEGDADAMARLLSTPADEVCSPTLLHCEAWTLTLPHAGACLNACVGDNYEAHSPRPERQQTKPQVLGFPRRMLHGGKP